LLIGALPQSIAAFIQSREHIEYISRLFLCIFNADDLTDYLAQITATSEGNASWLAHEL
jgi:hypothetical protein